MVSKHLKRCLTSSEIRKMQIKRMGYHLHLVSKTEDDWGLPTLEVMWGNGLFHPLFIGLWVAITFLGSNLNILLKNQNMHMSFDPIISPFERNKCTNTKVAIAAVIVKNRDEVGVRDVHQFSDNWIAYTYNMQYYNAMNKHALDLRLLTGEDPHHREELSPTISMCILLRARKSYGNKYLKLLTLITSRGWIWE